MSDQHWHDDHEPSVAPPPIPETTPTPQPATGDGQGGDDAHRDCAIAPPPTFAPTPTFPAAAGDGHRTHDAQSSPAVAPPPTSRSTPKPATAASDADEVPAAPTREATPRGSAARPDPAYAALVVDGEALDDLERLRIATANRIDALDRDDLGDLAGARQLLAALETAEKIAVRNIERTMRAHPLGAFVAQTPGLGAKSVARLLALTGDPADRARPSSLTRYCGMAVVDGVAPARRRGAQVDYNPKARTRLFLIAEACMKHRSSPYRLAYDQARAKYGDAVHVGPCVRCGPKDHPAPAGSALSDGHKHARALRAVAKAVLLDLWRVSVGLPPRFMLPPPTALTTPNAVAAVAA